MASVIKRIDLSREERECLEKAASILQEISDSMRDSSDYICNYENCEYVTDILNIYFEY